MISYCVGISYTKRTFCQFPSSSTITHFDSLDFTLLMWLLFKNLFPQLIWQIAARVPLWQTLVQKWIRLFGLVAHSELCFFYYLLWRYCCCHSWTHGSWRFHALEFEISSASNLLSSGFNKMRFHSRGPSWSLQSDVTWIDIGLHLLRVPVKQGLVLLLLLLCWSWPHTGCVRKYRAICLPRLRHTSFFESTAPVHFEERSNYSVSCKQIISHHSVTHTRHKRAVPTW